MERADLPVPVATTYSVRALRGVFWSGINVVLPTVSSLLVFVVTSRMLTPADFGIVAIAGAFAAGASASVPAGFGDALVQRMEKDPVYLDSVFWLCLAGGGAVYLVLVLLAGELSRLYDVPMLATIVPIVGLRILFDTAGVVPTALVTQAMSFHLIALRTLVATIASAVLSVVLVLSGFGLWALVASTLTNSFVATSAMFWNAGWTPRLRFNVKAIASLSHYGIYASGTRLLNFAGNQADQVFVGLILGPVQLGFYNFARRVFAILSDITSGALNSVAHPLFAGIQENRDRVQRGFLVATFLSSVIAFPLFIGLAVVADRAIPLLCGPQWDSALLPIRILCSLGIINCIGTLQAGLITGLGRPRWWFYYQLATTLLNIPLILVFAHNGTSALLLAIAVKAYLLWPIPVAMTVRLLSLRASRYIVQFLPPLVASLVMSIAILAGRELMPPLPPAVALVTDLAVGFATYAFAFLAIARDRLASLVTLARGVMAGRR